MTLKQHLQNLQTEIEDIEHGADESRVAAVKLLNFAKAQDRIKTLAENEFKRSNFEFYCRYGYFYGGN